MITDFNIEAAWLRVGDAAKYGSCGRTSLYKALADGRIEGRKAFGRTLISRASMDAYLAHAPRVGAAMTLHTAKQHDCGCCDLGGSANG